jgi:hypothetical protein
MMMALPRFLLQSTDDRARTDVVGGSLVVFADVMPSNIMLKHHLITLLLRHLRDREAW